MPMLLLLALLVSSAVAVESLPALPPYPVPELPPDIAQRAAVVRPLGREAIAATQIAAERTERAIGYDLAAELAHDNAARQRLLLLAAAAAEGDYRAHLTARCLALRLTDSTLFPRYLSAEDRQQASSAERLWLRLQEARQAAEQGTWATALAVTPDEQAQIATAPAAAAFFAALRAADPRSAAQRALEDKAASPEVRQAALREARATTSDELLATRLRWELVHGLGHKSADAAEVETWSRQAGRSSVGVALGAALTAQRQLLIDWDGPAGTASTTIALTALRQPVPIGLEEIAAGVSRTLLEQLPDMRVALLDPGPAPPVPAWGPSLGGWPWIGVGTTGESCLMVPGSPRTNWTFRLALWQRSLVGDQDPPAERLADATADQRRWLAAWNIMCRQGSASYPLLRPLPREVIDPRIRDEVIGMVIRAAFMLGDVDDGAKVWDEVLATYPTHPECARLQQARVADAARQR